MGLNTLDEKEGGKIPTNAIRLIESQRAALFHTFWVR